MLKRFLMKKMLSSQLKGVPEDQQNKILDAIEKNPDFFKKVATEVQEKMKQGKDQMSATQEVMAKYQSKLMDVMK